MWENVFSECPEAVKCSNFLGGHLFSLNVVDFALKPYKCRCRYVCGGRVPKTTGFCTVVCILQFSLISEYFSTLG